MTENDDLVVTFDLYAPASDFENIRVEIEPYLYAMDVLKPSRS